MPSKDCGLVHGARVNIINKATWKKYVKVSGNDIDYNTFRDIIQLSNELIKDRVSDNISGYKLSESLGYFVVKRYKPKAGVRSIDYQKSKQAGCLVYHTNFHSFGYKARILWLTSKVSTCKNIGIYKFIPSRDFQRGVSERMFAGKLYHEYSYDDFKARKIRLNLNKLN